eukprot:1461849-Rhodomonas_salina.3
MQRGGNWMHSKQTALLGYQFGLALENDVQVGPSCPYKYACFCGIVPRTLNPQARVAGLENPQALVAGLQFLVFDFVAQRRRHLANPRTCCSASGAAYATSVPHMA